MIRLTTLGATDLRDRRGHVVRDVLAQPKRLALLVYLAIESRRQPVSRDKLLALFWPESDATKARNTLSQALHHLRQAIGAEAIESPGAATIQVKPDLLWCDTVAFLDALERGEGDLALDLYRGDFCPALFISGAQELEAWIEEQRVRFRRQALAAARTLAEKLAAQGDTAAPRVARRALELRPEDEADVRAMLAVLERSGDATGALLAYESYAARLARELELEPEAATRQLADDIRLRREQQTAAPAATVPFGLPQATPTPLAVLTGLPLPRRIAAGIMFLVFASAGGIAWVRSARPDTLDQTIAVLPFTVRGSDDLLFMGEGMVDLLSAKLDGAGGLRAVDPHSVVTAAQAHQDEDQVTMARRLGARRYIRGDVVVSAGRVEINASLYEGAGRRSRAVARAAGDTSALFELVNGVAGQLLAGLTEGRDTTITNLAAINTSSLPALKAFLAGEQALRRGNDTQAATFFREAAELDTTFALAQYRLALAATWVRTPAAENPTYWAARAASNASRLTPLARDLLTAYQAYRETRAETAERIYRRITTARPDNIEAWLMLGETLFHFNPERGRSMYEAKESFERVLRYSPANAHALLHLARLAAAADDRRALDSLARRYMALHRDADRLLEIRALVAFVSGSDAERAAIIAEAGTTDDWVVSSMVTAARAYAEQPDLAPRLALAGLMPLRHNNVRQQSRWFVTDGLLASGRWAALDTSSVADPQWRLESQALLAAEPFLGVDTAHLRRLRDQVRSRRQWPPMAFNLADHRDPALGPAMQRYLAGLLSARLGDTAGVRAAGQALEAMPVGPYGFGGAELAIALRGATARFAGDVRGALEAYQEFRLSTASGPIPMLGLSHWGVAERYATAELLRALGRDSASLALYESFQGNFDMPFVPAAHFRRGELQLKLGNPERARFHFERAARMWRDADAEFRPLLDRANAALAGLPR